MAKHSQRVYDGFKGFRFTKVGRVLKKKYPTTLSNLIDSYDGFKVRNPKTERERTHSRPHPGKRVRYGIN